MDVDSDDSDDIQIEKYLTGSKIYRDLWTEFYSWEQVFCRQTIMGLSKHQADVRSSPPNGTPIYELPVVSSSSEQDFFTYEDISPDSSLTIKFTLSPDPKIVEIQNLDACAGYTACIPISMNLIMKDDPAFLPFAPHADDPLFDLDDYLSYVGWFTWQCDLHDPDRKYSRFSYTPSHG